MPTRADRPGSHSDEPDTGLTVPTLSRATVACSVAAVGLALAGLGMVVVGLSDPIALAGALVMLFGAAALGGGVLTAIEISSSRATKSAAHTGSPDQSCTCKRESLIAGLTHDLRSPVAAIIGHTELLDDPTIADADRAASLRVVRSNGEHLLALVNDVLDLSKLDAGAMKTECVECSPAQIVFDVVSMMRVHATERNIALELDYPAPCPRTIRSDPLRLKQVLINLVSNAIKFTERGEVRLTVSFDITTDDDSTMTIQVIDTGIGMSPDHIERLFEPFEQADASMARRFGGTGLGLAIVDRLVATLGGTIAVQSAPGKGSVFTLALPTGPLSHTDMIDNMQDGLDDTRHPAQGVRRWILRGRVLVVDDSIDCRRLVVFHLHRAGAEVDVAEDGSVGVQMVLQADSEGRTYDLVLMDMQMPVLDGVSATANLRQTGCTVPIVALTSAALPEDRDRCLQAGCNEFATKPITADCLGELCATYLQHDRAEAA